jgi:hypothetical protein
VLTQLLKEGSQRVQFRAKGAPIPAFNRSIDIPRPCRAGKQRELRVGDTVVAEIVDPAGRIEDQVLRPEALLDSMPGLLPAHRDATFQHEISVLHRRA